MPVNCPVLVHEWLKKSAAALPDKTAVICGNSSVTFHQLNEQSDNLANVFRRYGLSHQDRVLIFLDNSIEAVIALFAVMKAGGVFVFLNGQLRAAKLAFILEDAQARFLITSGQKMKTVQEALEKSAEKPRLIFTGSNEKIRNSFPGSLDFKLLIKESGDLSNLPPACRMIDQDLSALIYTSGSTGNPKGVMTPHLNMIAASRSVIQYTELNFKDVILCVLPLSYGYGLYQVIMSVMCGSTVVLERSFAYFHQFLLKISAHQVTAFPVVPTVVAMMLNLPDLSQYDFSSLRFITTAGAALPVEHIQRLRSLLPDVQIYSMYGLTECKRVSYLPPEQIDIRPDSVGKAIPNCRVFIVDEAGTPVKTGEVGELIIQGANVMPGYWGKDPEETSQVYKNGPLPNQRYLYSGDYFKQDEEGYLYFLGRKNDMIKIRGERVSPKEIENILTCYSGVAEAAVIGIPDPVLGEVPKAFVVKSSSSDVSEEELKKYAAEHMERVMVPQTMEFIKSLPKTPNGKIDKRTLKDREVHS